MSVQTENFSLRWRERERLGLEEGWGGIHKVKQIAWHKIVLGIVSEFFLQKIHGHIKHAKHLCKCFC